MRPKYWNMKLLRATCFLWLLTLATTSQAQTPAKGFVYIDTNGNKKKDKKEKGIEGVAVSNGIEVTLTDKNGAYELPIGNDNIIFVVKPSGYKLPLNSKNQPIFYHIHKPVGTPANFKFKGSAPTGPLPGSIDFAVIPTTQEDKFSALVFGDPQPYTLEEIDYFSRGIVKEVEGIKGISFGLSLGDLVGDNLDLHNPYIDAVQKVGIPWYNVIGNHDMNYDAVTDSLSDETYEANFGPANYSFNEGNVHFIVLDDIIYPDPRDGKGYWGGFREDQLRFLENDLKLVDTSKLIVFSMHIPLKMYNDAFRPEDRNRLFQLLQRFPHTLSLSAHTHLQRNDLYGKSDGWLRNTPHHEYNAGTTSGDWYSGQLDENGIPYSTMRDGTPKGYAFLHFNGNQYVIDYKVAGKPASFQIEIFAPKVIPFKKKTSAGIYANFFMGREDSKVEYKIDNAKWKKMEFAENFDPNFLGILHKFDHSETLIPGKRPSNPEASSHLWRTAIPNNLALGEHTIEVRATDMFGRVFTQKGSFKVAALEK